MTKKKVDIHEIQQELFYLLQTTELDRNLDSLEITVIKACLTSKGIMVNKMQGYNTIRGWLEWLQPFLQDGR